MKVLSAICMLVALSVVTLFRQIPVWWKIGRGRRGTSSSNVFLP